VNPYKFLHLLNIFEDQFYEDNYRLQIIAFIYSLNGAIKFSYELRENVACYLISCLVEKDKNWQEGGNVYQVMKKALSSKTAAILGSIARQSIIVDTHPPTVLNRH